MTNDLAGIGITEEMSDEQVETHIKRLRRDIEYMAPRLLKVQTTGGDLVPLKLNRPQRLLGKIFKKIKLTRLLRTVILKGRRQGITTYISARLYQKTSLFHNRHAMQVTHEPQASEFVFGMVKRYYNNCPAELRPETVSNNARLLEFNNSEGSGLDSAFRVATAGKEDIGSSQLIHLFHASELAKWAAKKINKLLTAVLQTIPDKPITEVHFESTALGVGGEFYDRFWGARYRIWVKRLNKNGNPMVEETINTNAEEENDYTSIFFPWFIFEDNEMDPPPNFVRTKKEEKMAKRFGINDRQIYWYRYTVANKCKGSIEKMRQEQPSTPNEAFLGTGRPVFDNNKLAVLQDHAPHPIATYEILGGNFVAAKDGRFKVWQEPKTGGSYIVAADVAEGLIKGDASVAHVIDHRSGDQVAEWHGRCAPDEFGAFLAAIGKRYNNALLAPERNNHGLMVVTVLLSMGYKNLYVEMVPEPPGKPRKRYGWLTTTRTRPHIIDNLIQEAREGTHGIKSAELFGEMLSFKIQDDGKYEADTGRHDDRVIAAAIAKHLRQVTPLPSMRRANKNRLDAPKERGRGNWA